MTHQPNDPKQAPRADSRSRSLVRASSQLGLLIATAFFALQCARSGLDPGDLEYSSAGTISTAGNPTSGGTSSGGTSSGGTSSGGTSSGGTSSGGTSSGGTSSGGISSGGQAVTVPGCTPSPEVCNGRDDDCNGSIDDEIDAKPCPGGGNSYCIAGRMSACPKRCESCVPGSQRVCFVSYCEGWGIQTCTADGRTFGTCSEVKTPSACTNAAGSDGRNLAGLERCCIDQGLCCVDSEDIDGDGNHTEMLGRCEAVTCD